MQVWLGNVFHAGSGYLQDHVRVHFYVDPPPDIFVRGRDEACPKAKSDIPAFPQHFAICPIEFIDSPTLKSLLLLFESMILTCPKSMIFVSEINDFTSEIDDFKRCEIVDFVTRWSLISMFEIIDFPTPKSLIPSLESVILACILRKGSH